MVLGLTLEPQGCRCEKNVKDCQCQSIPFGWATDPELGETSHPRARHASLIAVIFLYLDLEERFKRRRSRDTLVSAMFIWILVPSMNIKTVSWVPPTKLRNIAMTKKTRIYNPNQIYQARKGNAVLKRPILNSRDLSHNTFWKYAFPGVHIQKCTFHRVWTDPRFPMTSFHSSQNHLTERENGENRLFQYMFVQPYSTEN